jgi:hypothetical protein
MSAGHHASMCSLVGITAFRLLWFSAFFGGSVAVLAWLLGWVGQPGWWFVAVPALVIAPVAGALMWAEVRCLWDTVVWLEPTPDGFRCRKIGRRRIYEVAWADVIATRSINHGGRRGGPTGRSYRTADGRFVMNWWSLPIARRLATPGAASALEPLGDLQSHR